MSYGTVLAIHVACVTASGTFFLVRCLWKLAGSTIRNRRWVRVTPHLVDTVLLLSGAYLATASGRVTAPPDWLSAKLGLLLAYILLGMVALRWARRRPVQYAAMAGAAGTFALIVSAAVTKTALPW